MDIEQYEAHQIGNVVFTVSERGDSKIRQEEEGRAGGDSGEGEGEG